MLGNLFRTPPKLPSKADLDADLTNLESYIREAVKKFEFERAAKLRDTIKDLRTKNSCSVRNSYIMQTYFPPDFKATKFTCPHCQVVAAQLWFDVYNDTRGSGLRESPAWKRCYCTHCKNDSYWYQGRMIVPTSAPVEHAHPDLPAECQEDYDEARDIVGRSPRAAAALLRLLVQKLMPMLGEIGKNINDDIGNLVKKGLPVEIQQALDYCRVVGNNAVHPGEIDLNDTPEVAHNLFHMINFIVEDRISRPNKVKGLYEKLPDTARAAIEKRDAPKAS